MAAEKKTLAGPRKNVSPLHAHFSFGTKKERCFGKGTTHSVPWSPSGGRGALPTVAAGFTNALYLG